MPPAFGHAFRQIDDGAHKFEGVLAFYSLVLRHNALIVLYRPARPNWRGQRYQSYHSSLRAGLPSHQFMMIS